MFDLENIFLWVGNTEPEVIHEICQRFTLTLRFSHQYRQDIDDGNVLNPIGRYDPDDWDDADCALAYLDSGIIFMRDSNDEIYGSADPFISERVPRVESLADLEYRLGSYASKFPMTVTTRPA